MTYRSTENTRAGALDDELTYCDFAAVATCHDLPLLSGQNFTTLRSGLPHDRKTAFRIEVEVDA
jgi:hypothetical protein